MIQTFTTIKSPNRSEFQPVSKSNRELHKQFEFTCPPPSVPLQCHPPGHTTLPLALSFDICSKIINHVPVNVIALSAPGRWPLSALSWPPTGNGYGFTESSSSSSSQSQSKFIDVDDYFSGGAN